MIMLIGIEVGIPTADPDPEVSPRNLLWVSVGKKSMMLICTPLIRRLDLLIERLAAACQSHRQPCEEQPCV